MARTAYDELRRLVIEVADCGWNVATEITDGILARPDVALAALDPAAIRDWVVVNIETVHEALVERQQAREP